MNNKVFFVVKNRSKLILKMLFFCRQVKYFSPKNTKYYKNLKNSCF